jgi:hypothetical protein
LITGKILKTHLSKLGYRNVIITNKDQCPKNFLIHRLIAIAFIPNPFDLPEVNHINGKRDDNRIENLEWISRKDNNRHAVEVLGKPPRNFIRPVIQVDNNGDTIMQFTSALEAANTL